MALVTEALPLRHIMNISPPCVGASPWTSPALPAQSPRSWAASRWVLPSAVVASVEGAIIPHSVLAELSSKVTGWTVGFLYTCLSDGSLSLKRQVTLEVWCKYKFPVVRGSPRWKCTGSLLAAQCERAISKRCRSNTNVDYLSFYMSLSIPTRSGNRHASDIRRRIDIARYRSIFHFSVGGAPNYSRLPIFNGYMYSLFPAFKAALREAQSKFKSRGNSDIQKIRSSDLRGDLLLAVARWPRAKHFVKQYYHHRIPTESK